MTPRLPALSTPMSMFPPARACSATTCTCTAEQPGFAGRQFRTIRRWFGYWRGGCDSGIACSCNDCFDCSIIGAVATDAVEKIRDDRNREQHTVYVLKDPVTNRVEYVGRTKNYKARMNAHKNSHRGHLEPEIVADNLNYYEARVLEQEMMLKYHTINTLNNINNQINGISPRSNLGKAYVELKRGVANYLSNLISDRVYALFE